MTNAVSQVMTPLPTTTRLKIAYAGVTYSTGTPVVDWHYESNGAGAITMGTIPNGVDMTTLGGTAIGSAYCVVVARVQYTYTSPIRYVLAKTWALTESPFARPQ